MKKSGRALAVLLLLVLATAGCADIIMHDEDFNPTSGGKSPKTPMGAQMIRITSEPDGAKIMVVSMGTRQMQTYYAPADISYMMTPAMPTVLTVAAKGYKPKNIRLEGDKKEIHVILEKASAVSLSEYEGSMSGGMGGAVGAGTGTGTGEGTISPSGMPTPMDQGGAK